ncbi:MAG: TIR domain-containing protein, partial [Oscillospiraceae bacterium]|nr:TIR domain-containing protein [Oscillospiraceae bacterium]
MNREYKAFISYRHKPLDMQTAKSIHRRIEHYIIPRALRKDGKKKLGYVFRDQDELPISSDLTSSIREALDRSEYLIVICTPETGKSLWVLEEISYFLSHHDHSHVLAILAEGTSDESFPQALREIRSADGELIDTVEPLAANIVADSDRKRRRLFRTESLRILAALIGCAYDDLYRREQRYRLRRLALSMAAVIALAAGFIGMLLNRNAEIRANYVQALRNQSQYLASESLKALEDGDRLKAISLAIEALPAEGSERPRVSKAEYALGCALGAYLSPDNAGGAHAIGMLPHANNVTSFVVSDDATLLCSFCQGGALVGWDLGSMKELWTDPSAAKGVAGFRGVSELVAWTDAELYCIDAVSGERKWTTPVAALDGESWSMISRVCVAGETGDIVAATSKFICFVDGESGAVLRTLPWPKSSPEGEAFEVYAFAFQLSPDGNLLVTKCRSGAGVSGLIVLDLQDGSVRMLRFYDGDYYFADSYAFLGDRFFYSTMDLSAGSAYSVYDAKVMVRSENILHCVDLSSGETLWETAHASTSTGVNEMLRCDDTLTGEPLLVFAYA